MLECEINSEKKPQLQPMKGFLFCLTFYTLFLRFIVLIQFSTSAFKSFKLQQLNLHKSAKKQSFFETPKSYTFRENTAIHLLQIFIEFVKRQQSSGRIQPCQGCEEDLLNKASQQTRVQIPATALIRRYVILPQCTAASRLIIYSHRQK